MAAVVCMIENLQAHVVKDCEEEHLECEIVLGALIESVADWQEQGQAAATTAQYSLTLNHTAVFSDRICASISCTNRSVLAMPPLKAHRFVRIHTYTPKLPVCCVQAGALICAKKKTKKQAGVFSFSFHSIHWSIIPCTMCSLESGVSSIADETKLRQWHDSCCTPPFVKNAIHLCPLEKKRNINFGR